MRVGVNLSWLGAENRTNESAATVASLHALANRPRHDVEVVLFGLASLRREHPDLVARFESHTLPLRDGRVAVRALADHTWWRLMAARHRLDVVHDAGGRAPRVAGTSIVSVHEIPTAGQDGRDLATAVPLRIALGRRARRARVVVVASHAMRRRVIEALHLPGDRVRVVPWPLVSVPSGVHIETVRARFGIIGSIVLVPGLTTPVETHLQVAEALAELGRRHAGTTVVYTGGDEETVAEARARLAQRGLSTRAVVTGPLPPGTLPALQRNAAVVACPSIVEAFAFAALPALDHGIPVLAAAEGAAGEIVGDAGIRFPTGDVPQLVVELHRALGDEATRARLADAGPERARRFDPTSTADALLEAYRAAV